jgi:hypothetical protein
MVSALVSGFVVRKSLIGFEDAGTEPGRGVSMSAIEARTSDVTVPKETRQE